MAFFFFMSIMAISFFAQASAIEFEFISPQEVNAESEFQVEITAETAEDYDVKIYVHGDTRQYSEIFDGEKWRSPFNYISSSVPSVSTYRIIPHYIGETEICIKLRKASDNVDVSSACNQISVLGESSQSAISENNGEEEKFESDSEDFNNERIILNSPNLEKNSYQTVTSDQRLRIWILYSFSFFCLVIIILLALKTL